MKRILCVLIAAIWLCTCWAGNGSSNEAQEAAFDRELRRKKKKRKGKTILIITHDYEFAAMTCNRVLHFVDEGHVETFSLQENLPRLYSCLMCQ